MRGATGLSGLMLLGRRKDSRPYAKRDIQFFTTICNQAGPALENAFHYETLIENKKQLEKMFNKIVQSEKMAALGEMATVLAHELKNPLGIIRSSAQYLTGNSEDAETRKELLEYIMGEVDGLSSVINNMMGLARYKAPEFTAVDLNRETATDGEDGIVKWKSFQPDVVFTDLKMPRADGMEVLKHRNLKYPETPLIILTAFGTVSTAVDAMKKGAFDYITKPVDNDIIIEKVKAALAGKELAARTIHDLSSRRHNPFIRVNCAAIPRELMESELFGHIKGSFTRALQDRKGSFIQADSGTLFLDEIGDMLLDLQAKVLHAVEDKLIMPVGSSEPVKIDIKIISATNQNVGEMVEQKKFRSDLYFRLNAYTIKMPSLKERPGDIPELVQHFLSIFNQEFNLSPSRVMDSAMDEFSRYSWPGNVRELKNRLERLVLVSKRSDITRNTLRYRMKKFGLKEEGCS